MKDLLLPLIATRNGWAFRQLLKGVAIVCASLSTWLLSHGANPEVAASITAGVGAALAWGAEFGLSRLARHVATPCLALCLFLTSCGVAPNGEKTFAGVTGSGWLKAGEETAIVLLSERSKTSAKQPVSVQPSMKTEYLPEGERTGGWFGPLLNLFQ